MKLTFLNQETDFNRKRFKRPFNTSSLRLSISHESGKIARFGIIIPKKVLPKAVDRNKVKRRIKAILRKHFNHFNQVDILILPQKSSLKVKFGQLESEIMFAIKKLNQWK
jgi:ribonuclease P protein component